MYLVQEGGTRTDNNAKKKKNVCATSVRIFYFLLPLRAIDAGTWRLAFSLSSATTKALYLMVAILQKAFSSLLSVQGSLVSALRCIEKMHCLNHGNTPPSPETTVVDYWL